MVIIYMCLIWHGCLKLSIEYFNFSNKTAQILDKTVMGLLLALYFVVHFILYRWLKKAYSYRNKMFKIENEMKDK
jgi:hypothetical protein